MEYLTLRTDFIHCCAATYWDEALYQEREETDYREDHGGGRDYTKDQLTAADEAGVFYDLPNEALEIAVELLEEFDKHNLTILAAVLRRMQVAHVLNVDTLDNFAHYLAMQAMGHGVGLHDFAYAYLRDTPELYDLFHELNVPHVEAYTLDDVIYTRVMRYTEDAAAAADAADAS